MRSSAEWPTVGGVYAVHPQGKAATQWHDKKMTVADLFQKKEKTPYDGTYTYTFAKPVVPRAVHKCPSHLPVRMLLLTGSGEHPPSFICVNLPRKNLKVKGVLQEIAKVRGSAGLSSSRLSEIRMDVRSPDNWPWSAPGIAGAAGASRGGPGAGANNVSVPRQAGRAGCFHQFATGSRFSSKHQQLLALLTICAHLLQVNIVRC